MMQNIVHTITYMVADVGIPNVALDELELWIAPKSRDILCIPRGQIVQHTNPVPHRQDRFAQIRADKARAAGNEKYTAFRKYSCTAVHSTPSQIYHATKQY